MKCLETQSKIVGFIEDELNDEDMVKFVKHIRYCENCAEELEIYYTLLVGMQQLDNDEQLSNDLKGDLNYKLNHAYSHIVNRKKIRISSILMILAIIIGGLSIVYSNFLKILYISEQAKIKENQPDYMYYEYFGDAIYDQEIFNLLEPYDDGKEDVGLDFYGKIRAYNLTHENISSTSNIIDSVEASNKELEIE